MKPEISLTPAATAYIKKMLKKSNGMGFRLSVKKTGCSGYSYSLSVVDKTNENDLILKTDDDITMLIDTAWQDLLASLHIDYVEEKSGLKQKRLVFTNPRETGRCGCGESFHVE